MEDNRGQFTYLPDELVIKIFTFLDYRELCRIGACCQRLQVLFQHESLWKDLCRRYWIDEGMKYSKESWCKNFCAWFADMGRYVDCYASIKLQWNRIEAALKERCPAILQSLKGPAVEQELSVVESQLPVCLPTEVRCFYRIRQGQVLDQSVGGLYGSMMVYHHHSSEYLMTVASEQMLQVLEIMLEIRNAAILPLTVCPFSGLSQGLCLQSMPGIRAGQIFYCSPSTRDRHTYDSEQDDPVGYFVTANSFMEWLTALADRLSDTAYTVMKERFYKFYNEPSCVAITNDVKVCASTAFVPELSRVETEEKLLTYFAYRITLSMDQDAPASSSCRLSHRHWEVTDANGKTEIVDGEGVIGETPTIKPGSTFTWISCTSFETPSGDMKGWFKVHNLRTGNQYNIICPCFHMESLPISRVVHVETAEDSKHDGTTV